MIIGHFRLVNPMNPSLENRNEPAECGDATSQEMETTSSFREESYKDSNSEPEAICDDCEDELCVADNCLINELLLGVEKSQSHVTNVINGFIVSVSRCQMNKLKIELFSIECSACKSELFVIVNTSH